MAEINASETAESERVIQKDASNKQRIGLETAKDTEAKIRSYKKEFDLVIEPELGTSPAALLERIENEAKKCDEKAIYQIFSAEVKANYVVVHFYSESEKNELVRLLLEKGTMTSKQIKTNDDLKSNRFLIKNLNPAKFKSKKDANKLYKKLIKYQNSQAIDFLNILQILDVNDGLAIAMVRHLETANYLVHYPNLFIGRRPAIAVLYPPGPFCDTCCSLEHTDSDCNGELKCYECGGAHAGNTCLRYGSSCANCSAHPMFKKSKPHSAKSSLCKAKIQNTLKKLGMTL